jgi:hypothetical protein
MKQKLRVNIQPTGFECKLSAAESLIYNYV